MFLINTSRISASNVIKMFINTFVTIGCTFVDFHLYKPTRSIHVIWLPCRVQNNVQRIFQIL